MSTFLRLVVLYTLGLLVSTTNGFTLLPSSLPQQQQQQQQQWPLLVPKRGTTKTTTCARLSLLDTTADLASLSMFPLDQLDPHHYHGVLLTTATTTSTTTAPNLFLADNGGGGLVDTIRNVAIAVTALVFFLAGLTYATASVIIPAAAKELEQECKELAPDLWDEYQQRLEPGQSMAQRPELMQELGAKLQPLLDAKIEKQFADQKAQGMMNAESSSPEEKAWRALDNYSQTTASKKTSTLASTGTILDITATPDQWDDDEENAGKNSRQKD